MDLLRKLSRSRSGGRQSEDEETRNERLSRRDEFENEFEDEYLTSNDSHDEEEEPDVPGAHTEQARSSAGNPGAIDPVILVQADVEPNSRNLGARPKKTLRSKKYQTDLLSQLLYKVNMLEAREKKRSALNTDIGTAAIEKFENFSSTLEAIKSRLDVEDTPQIQKWVPIPPLENAGYVSYETYLKNAPKFELLFKNVPTFSGDKGCSVREFLNNLNTIVCDRRLKLTPDIFRAILLGKLHSDVRTVVTGGEIQSEKPIEDIYKALISHYDNSEDMTEAITKLYQLRRGTAPADSYTSFVREANRLLTLSDTKDKDKDFATAALNVLPSRVRELFREFLTRKIRESATNAYPCIDRMLAFLQQFRKELETAFASSAPKHKPKIREVRDENDDRPNREKQPPKRWCTNCKTDTHDTEKCFILQRRTLICHRCKQQGHIAKNCKVRCRLCFAKEHVATECPVYPSQITTQKMCQYCAKYNLELYHPERLCALNKDRPKN